MKQKTFSTLFLILIPPIIISGCLWDSPQKPAAPPESTLEPEGAARDFFDALHDGDYEVATSLYGGSWEVLTDMNPDHDPGDGPGLLAQGCQFNGFTCLQMGEVIAFDRADEGEFTLVVQFLTDSGEVFRLGPCCGADETEMPPVSEFPIRVIIDPAGEYKILDLPPYVP